jgi:transcriptional regulator with XRE-family HTH domain
MKYIKRMRDLREDHDKTQQNIADILGTSQTMYARYERGANELPIHHSLVLFDYFLFKNLLPNQRFGPETTQGSAISTSDHHYYQVSADYFLGRTDKK